MRLHKNLFLVFLVLYFIAGLSLLITGSVAHQHAAQCKSIGELEYHSLLTFVLQTPRSPVIRWCRVLDSSSLSVWSSSCSQSLVTEAYVEWSHHSRLLFFFRFHRSLQESSESTQALHWLIMHHHGVGRGGLLFSFVRSFVRGTFLFLLLLSLGRARVFRFELIWFLLTMCDWVISRQFHPW